MNQKAMNLTPSSKCRGLVLAGGLVCTSFVQATGPGDGISTPVVQALPQSFSTGMEQIIKLARAGVGEEVLATFIWRSTEDYEPTADEIILLSDLGVAKRVIAMLMQPAGQRHLPERTSTMDAPSTPAVVQSVPATPVSAPPAVQPNVVPVVVESDPVTLVELPPQETRVVRYFWPSLEPFGTWVQMRSYGWCWRPAVAVSDPGWRPYANRGRWIYSDCGWYWHSDYSWGWATFHYGRWFLDSSQGWCWVPDQVWSPAWVSWRSSGDYCGWAPLPPLGRHISSTGYATITAHDFGIHASFYSYVPLANLCEDSPLRFGLVGVHRDYIHSRSASQNHFRKLNDGIANAGLNASRYQTANGGRIAQVSVRTSDSNSSHRPDQLARHGNSTVVYKSRLEHMPIAPGPARDFDRGESRPTFATARHNVERQTSTIEPSSPVTSARSSHDNARGRNTGNASVQGTITTGAGVPIYSGHQGGWDRRSREESSDKSTRQGTDSYTRSVRPLSPPQPITSVPQSLGVDPRPFTPPQPITSVPQALGVDARPLTPPQPVTANPGFHEDGTRRVREAGRYEPSRTADTAKPTPLWEQTARRQFDPSQHQSSWERIAVRQIQQQPQVQSQVSRDRTSRPEPSAHSRPQPTSPAVIERPAPRPSVPSQSGRPDSSPRSPDNSASKRGGPRR